MALTRQPMRRPPGAWRGFHSSPTSSSRIARSGKVGREWRLPRWQFDPDNTTGALPDLDVLQAAFPGGPVSLSRWMMRPHPEFDGRTPREETIAHGSKSVIKVARTLTAAGW